MRIAILTLAVPALCLAQEAPNLIPDASIHDFGQIGAGIPVAHTFKLTNRGSALLSINKLTAGCGCTSTLLGKGLLAAGESTELEVTFNPAGLQGLIQRSVTVESNDPVHPNLVLSFTATVLDPVVVASDTTLFQDLRPDDRRKASVRLHGTTGRPISILNVALSEAPWLGVATRQEGEDAFVDLELVARRLPPGVLFGTDTVDVQVSNPVESMVKLKVRWEQLGPVIATPERVSWVAEAGKPLSTKVLLEHRDHQPFRILSSRATHSFLHATVLGPGAAAARQSIRVDLDAGVQPGPFDEKLYLTLDTPGHPEFELRVVASLR